MRAVWAGPVGAGDGAVLPRFGKCLYDGPVQGLVAFRRELDRHREDVIPRQRITGQQGQAGRTVGDRLRQRGRKARQSYQYVDVLTGMVELTNPENEQPLFPALQQEAL